MTGATPALALPVVFRRKSPTKAAPTPPASPDTLKLACDSASDEYEVAEAEYLRLLRQNSERSVLAAAARAVATAAARWYESDLAREFALPEDQRPVREYYDVSEVVSEIWSDIASAYEEG